MKLALEDLEVYRFGEQIADIVWDICSAWNEFARSTLGRQFVRAADSIGANIAEGYGRYSFKENIQFCYYARGSLMETKHFLRRSQKRGLLSADQQIACTNLIDTLAPKLNAYIRSIRIQANISKLPAANDK